MPRRRYRVQWAEVAVRDLEELVGYIASDSAIHADRVLTRLETRAAALESSAGRGRIVPELLHFGMRSWRELFVRPYRIVYRIEGNTVTVLGVFDERRDLEDVLLERLLRDA